MSPVALAFLRPCPRSKSAGFLKTRRGRVWLLTGLTFLAMIGWLAWLGRPWGPDSGLRWWNGDARAVHNSQHLADAYSLLHLGFGMMIWAVVTRFGRGADGAGPSVALIASAAAWEMIENLPQVIALFAPIGSAAGYQGDSIVNALSDVGFAAAGFLVASRLSWPALWIGLPAIEIASTLLVADGYLLGLGRLAGITT